MSAAGDITQPDVLRDVQQAIFRPTGGPALRSVLDAHFADNVIVKNPFFQFTGRKNLYHLFHLWQNTFDDRFEMLSMATNGNVILVKNRHNLMIRPLHLVKHWMPGFVTDLLTMPVLLNIELLTSVTPTGTKIISMKEDVSLYTLILNILWPTKVLPVWSWLEMAVGQGVVIADQVGTKACDLLEPVLGPYSDKALQTTDKLLKDTLGLDLGLSNAKKRFWA